MAMEIKPSYAPRLTIPPSVSQYFLSLSEVAKGRFLLSRPTGDRPIPPLGSSVFKFKADASVDYRKKWMREAAITLYGLLSHFQPVGRNEYRVDYIGVDHRGGHSVDIFYYLETKIVPPYILISHDQKCVRLDLVPQEDTRFFNEEDVPWIARVLSRLQRRLSNLQHEGETTRLLREDERLQERKIRVPEWKLLPGDRIDGIRYRLLPLMEKAKRIPGVTQIPWRAFIQVTAALVKKRYPAKTEITCEENTWEELYEHGGVDDYHFPSLFKPSGAGGDTIDLKGFPKGYSNQDHVFEPIIGGFRLVPRLKGGLFYFVIVEGEDDGFGFETVPWRLDLYEILIQRGLPVLFEPAFLEDANGDSKVSVSLRLWQQHLFRSRETYAYIFPYSYVLPPTETLSLPPLDLRDDEKIAVLVTEEPGEEYVEKERTTGALATGRGQIDSPSLFFTGHLDRRENLRAQVHFQPIDPEDPWRVIRDKLLWRSAVSLVINFPYREDREFIAQVFLLTALMLNLSPFELAHLVFKIVGFNSAFLSFLKKADAIFPKEKIGVFFRNPGSQKQVSGNTKDSIFMGHLLEMALHGREQASLYVAVIERKAAQMGLKLDSLARDYVEQAPPLEREVVAMVRENGGELRFADFFPHVMCLSEYSVYNGPASDHLIAPHDFKGRTQDDAWRQLTGDPNEKVTGPFFKTPSEDRSLGNGLAAFAMKAWQKLGRPNRWTLCEMGAGKGTLAANLLENIQSAARHHGGEWKGLEAATTYHIVEINRAFQEKQRENLAAFGDRVHFTLGSALDADFPDIDAGMIISVELLDMFPPTLVRYDQKEMRESVVIERGGIIQEKYVPLKSRTRRFLEQYEVHWEVGKDYAAHLGIPPWLSHLKKKLKRGYVWTCDYGGRRDELMSCPHRSLIGITDDRNPNVISFRLSLKDELFPLEGGAKAWDYVFSKTGLRWIRDLSTLVDFQLVQEAARQEGFVEVAYQSLDDFLAKQGVSRPSRDSWNSRNSSGEDHQSPVTFQVSLLATRDDLRF